MQTTSVKLNETIIEPRFSEIDALGIVHHSRYIPWVEEANFNFVRNVLKISRKELLKMEMYNPIKKILIDYKNHVGWNDKVLVECHMVYSQFSFFIMKNILRSMNEEKKVFAEVEVKVLITDRNLKLKIMAPDFFMNKIENAAENYPEYFSILKEATQNTSNKYVGNTESTIL
jgi:acyl-CoA thioester hydrolase